MPELGQTVVFTGDGHRSYRLVPCGHSIDFGIWACFFAAATSHCSEVVKGIGDTNNQIKSEAKVEMQSKPCLSQPGSNHGDTGKQD
jgi:hypothetical protein